MLTRTASLVASLKALPQYPSVESYPRILSLSFKGNGIPWKGLKSSQDCWKVTSSAFARLSASLRESVLTNSTDALGREGRGGHPFIFCLHCSLDNVWPRALDHQTRRYGTFQQIWWPHPPVVWNPFNASSIFGLIATILGTIYLDSSTAVNAFIGSFVCLMSLSYICTILPYLFGGRCTVMPGSYRIFGIYSSYIFTSKL